MFTSANATRRGLATLLAACAVTVGSLSTAQARGPKGSAGSSVYTIVSLGFPSWSEATAINDDGWVAGTFDDADSLNHVFLVVPLDTDGDGSPDTWFQDADGDDINDLMLDVVARHAYDRPRMNNLGQIAACRDGAAGALQPFLWDPVSGFQDIDILVGYTSLELWGMNGLGQVVGIAVGGTPHAQAFLWDPDLGAIGLGTPGRPHLAQR